MTSDWPGVWHRDISGVVKWNSNTVYFFKGPSYQRLDIDEILKGNRAFARLPIKGNWPGWPEAELWNDGFDTVVNGDNNNIYFFKGKRCLRYWKGDNDLPEGAIEVYDISERWPGLWDDGIDAAINWGNNFMYFFKGSTYVQYWLGGGGRAEGIVGDAHEIKDYWPGLFIDGIDAAVNWGNGYAVFFKGSAYQRYWMGGNGVAEVGFPPQPISLARGRLTGAVILGDVVYFLYSSQYVRFSISADCVDAEPTTIAGNWPGLWADDIDAMLDLGNGFVDFFKGNRCQRYWMGGNGRQEGVTEMRSISDFYPGLWTYSDFDATVNCNGSAFFFKGDRCQRYWLGGCGEQRGAKESTLIQEMWPGLWASDIDAAVYWSGNVVYFFKGSKYKKCALGGSPPSVSVTTAAAPTFTHWRGLQAPPAVAQLCRTPLPPPNCVIQ
jgi:hypothetical protein